MLRVDIKPLYISIYYILYTSTIFEIFVEVSRKSRPVEMFKMTRNTKTSGGGGWIQEFFKGDGVQGRGGGAEGGY